MKDDLFLFILFFTLNLFDSYSINTSTNFLDYLMCVFRWARHNKKYKSKFM